MNEKTEHIDDSINYVRHVLPMEELLAQMAEEATELAQAALKLRRAINGTNPTPVNVGAAWEDVKEEFADVLVCKSAIFGQDNKAIRDDIDAIKARKAARWASRIREAGETAKSAGEYADAPTIMPAT